MPMGHDPFNSNKHPSEVRMSIMPESLNYSTRSLRYIFIYAARKPAATVLHLDRPTLIYLPVDDAMVIARHCIPGAEWQHLLAQAASRPERPKIRPKKEMCTQPKGGTTLVTHTTRSIASSRVGRV